MGTRFLRHVERTSVLLHLLDISSESEQDAWQDYDLINRELGLFSPDLLKKPQIIAISKVDLPLTRERMKKDIDIFAKKGLKVFTFSAATGEGVQALLREIIFRIAPFRPAGEEGGDGSKPEEQPS